MVKVLNENNREYYECDVCGAAFLSTEYAERCERLHGTKRRNDESGKRTDNESVSFEKPKEE